MNEDTFLKNKYFFYPLVILFISSIVGTMYAVVSRIFYNLEAFESVAISVALTFIFFWIINIFKKK